MAITVQLDIALSAAEGLSKRRFSTAGNATKKKVRVFRTPKGRHLAIILTNQVLTAVTEPVYVSTLDVPGEHKRRYAPDDPRNSNLNFGGSRLAVGNSIDWWNFQSLGDFEAFSDWYGEQDLSTSDAEGCVVAQKESASSMAPELPVEEVSETRDNDVEVNLFSRFRAILESSSAPSVRDHRLLMEEDGPVKIYYAPFEYLNRKARIVLVGITPGPTQMANANNEARRTLLAGASESDAIKAAKDTAAFSGEPMRSNLVRQLDHWGFHEWLGLETSSELFSSARSLVQTTSLLRYPVFVNDDDYRGNPDMLKHPMLRKQLMTYFVDEVEALDQAVFIGLGPQVQKILDSLVDQGVLGADRVIGGMLHPSGNCTYRINHLIGDRMESTPHATNPESYDRGRAGFREKYLRS